METLVSILVTIAERCPASLLMELMLSSLAPSTNSLHPSIVTVPILPKTIGIRTEASNIYLVS